jgi:hypothetical protein
MYRADFDKLFSRIWIQFHHSVLETSHMSSYLRRISKGVIIVEPPNMGKKVVSAIGVACRGLPLEAASRDEVGREGIEPSWVAPGDFKSPASTVSPPPHTGSVALCA